MMKKYLVILVGLFSLTLHAQARMKDYSNIMKSNNIYEIAAFLRDASPNDSRRNILKPKVIDMIKEYIKNALPFDQRIPQLREMIATLENRPSDRLTYEEFTAKIREKHLAYVRAQMTKMSGMTEEEMKNSHQQYAQGNSGEAVSAAAGVDNYVNPEEKEFNELIAITNPEEHKKKTVNVLNSLFDNDPNAKEVVVIIENKSNCNIIVRMEGTNGKKYNLPVPTQKENSILIEKGDYTFTSLVCGANYISKKEIQKTLMVTLSNPRD